MMPSFLKLTWFKTKQLITFFLLNFRNIMLHLKRALQLGLSMLVQMVYKFLT